MGGSGAMISHCWAEPRTILEFLTSENSPGERVRPFFCTGRSRRGWETVMTCLTSLGEWVMARTRNQVYTAP